NTGKASNRAQARSVDVILYGREAVLNEAPLWGQNIGIPRVVNKAEGENLRTGKIVIDLEKRFVPTCAWRNRSYIARRIRRRGNWGIASTDSVGSRQQARAEQHLRSRINRNLVGRNSLGGAVVK